MTKLNCSVNNDILTESLCYRVRLGYVKISCCVCLHLRNINKLQIRIRQLGNFNIRRMLNAVKLFEIRQHSNSNSNFVTSLASSVNSIYFHQSSFLSVIALWSCSVISSAFIDIMH